MVSFPFCASRREVVIYMKKLYCCEQMQTQIVIENLEFPPFSNPDNFIYYNEKFDEYGIIIFDGGQSYIIINYCPWCGKKLPKSKRIQWFEELVKLGYDSPYDQEIPEEFKTGNWRKDI